MPKLGLFSLALAVIVTSASITLIFNDSLREATPKREIDTAINQAKYLYRQSKEAGADFSGGPCLSNALMPDWVVDIVHNPRLPADDLPQNQCPSYREGKATHFIELDLDGNLIRAR